MFIPRTRHIILSFLVGIIFVSGVSFARPQENPGVPSVSFKFVRAITQPEDGYSAWGTIGLLEGDSLVAVYSGGRKTHVDPYGQLRISRSSDGGLTWDASETLHNSIIDDRDGGFLKTDKGTLIVTWFTSLAWRDNLREARKRPPGSPRAWDPKILTEWNAIEARVTPDVVAKEWGAWAIRSTDGGKTWSPPINTIVNSPHGPAMLTNGQLLYVGKEMWKSDRILSVVSEDDGLTWKIIGEIPVREGDKDSDYHEAHAVQAADGRIIVQIRNHNPADKGETLQSESLDNGKTWTPLHAIGVVGYPSHLLKLKDDSLLMTYGTREPPYAIQVRKSLDNGQTWSAPEVLAAHFSNWDMGYPSTVQLNDGTLVTAWYEHQKGSSQMKSLRWKIQ